MYVLVVALGLAMVWLGFLYAYELNIADRSEASTRAFVLEKSNSVQTTAEQAQTAGIGSKGAVNEAGTGLPIALAGVGLIFVLGGAVRVRHQA